MMRPPHTLALQRRQALFSAADEQAGYFTAKQAEAAGFSRRVQQHHAQSGTWRREGHGLFRLAQYPVSDHEQYVRLTLWSRNRQGEPQAALGFETALAFYELSDLAPAQIHLNVPPAFRKAAPPGVVLHKGQWEPGDLQSGTGYQVTTPLRTLLDLAGGTLSPEHLEQGLREALTRGLVRRRAALARLAALTPHARERLTLALAAL